MNHTERAQEFLHQFIPLAMIMVTCLLIYLVSISLTVLLLWRKRDDMTAGRWKFLAHTIHWVLFSCIGFAVLVWVPPCGSPSAKISLRAQEFQPMSVKERDVQYILAENSRDSEECQDVPDGRDCSWIGDVGICDGWCLCRFIRTHANPLCIDKSGKAIE